TQDPAIPLSFSLASTAYVGTGCTAPSLLALGDLNDSGTLDVVVGNTGTNNITVLAGNGSGAISFVSSYALLGPGNQVLTSVIVGDFNRDCRQDIVTASFNGENISIYLGRGDGTFADATNYDAEVAANRAGAAIQSTSPDASFSFLFALDLN